MKTIIISDTHKNINRAIDAIQSDETIGRIVHLGDVDRDALDLAHIFPEMELLAVSGNNDYNASYPPSIMFDIGPYKVFATHGHFFGVKLSLDKLYTRGKELGADVILFGHTHNKHDERRGAMTLLNPSNRFFILFDEQGEYEFKPL